MKRFVLLHIYIYIYIYKFSLSKYRVCPWEIETYEILG
jgi:hypothetical protein